MISARLIESACRVAITHDRSFAVRINRQIFSSFSDEIVKGD